MVFHAVKKHFVPNVEMTQSSNNNGKESIARYVKTEIVYLIHNFFTFLEINYP